MTKLKIGLALGGGGARGLAHLGVMKVFMAEGIVPDIITGTSIGAIIGAMFATGTRTEAVMDKVDYYFNCDCFDRIKFEFLKEAEEEVSGSNLFDALSSFFRKRIFYNVYLTNRLSFVSEEDFLQNISKLVDEIGLEDMAIPLGVVCTDIYAGDEVVLTQGSAVRAVAASAAIPGIFPPIDFQGSLLIDGGWVNELPISPCRELGADIVIGIEVGGKMANNYSLDTGLDVIRRSNAISRMVVNRLQAVEADIIVTPAVEDMSWADFSCVEECIRRGEEAAEKALPVIRDLIKERSTLVYRLTHPKK